MIYELRQYTLHPGKRDRLIDLFERHFLAGQEACGMSVPAYFRDADDPDRFVWFRAFPDMEARKDALTCFYDGPLWKEHREVANATMIDSDDVLLLREVDDRQAFPSSQTGPCTLTVYLFATPVDDELLAVVKRDLTAPLLLQTEPAKNTFPRLPVRVGEHVIVALEPAARSDPIHWPWMESATRSSLH
jgi:hypothetical protein